MAAEPAAKKRRLWWAVVVMSFISCLLTASGVLEFVVNGQLRLFAPLEIILGVCGTVVTLTPSNNIHCQLDEGTAGATGYLRCDIREMSNANPLRPRNCDLEWGDAFVIEQDGLSGQRLCHGDTVADEALLHSSLWKHLAAWRLHLQVRAERTDLHQRHGSWLLAIEN
jgi:hypothetical protein